ncbi:MAG TPA: hypothetical protein VNQ77_03030 [Frankiaceae bacterium]|nr:hypothetical protein [Frankiaceae bacterium]
MRITPLVLAGALAATALAGTATAAPKKKPITKSYDASAASPDPTNWANDAGGGYSVCAQRVPGSFHTHTFTAPALGKINIKVTGFTGDWDVLITDSKGTEIAAGGSSGINTPDAPTAGDESVTLKIKKAKSKINIITCNWVGGPSAKVKYVFTYA